MNRGNLALIHVETGTTIHDQQRGYLYDDFPGAERDARAIATELQTPIALVLAVQIIQPEPKPRPVANP